MTHAWESDFSFIGVETALLEKWGEKLLGPATEEELQKARPLLDKLEASRLASMAQYEKDKLPPFTRSSTERQIES